jgi:hypothetical protein
VRESGEHHWGEAWRSEISTLLQYVVLTAAFLVKDWLRHR